MSGGESGMGRLENDLDAIRNLGLYLESGIRKRWKICTLRAYVSSILGDIAKAVLILLHVANITCVSSSHPVVL
jgi:hypothetical protein